MEKIINHAAAAANAHGVSSKVASGEHWDGEKFTGQFFASVEFVQEIWTVPETDSNVSRFERRRIIGISAGDAKRLFKARKGRPGGQAYVKAQSATRRILEVADTPEAAARAVLDRILAGEARALAHDVADEAAAIEVAMRTQLRADIQALEPQSS